VTETEPRSFPDDHRFLVRVLEIFSMSHADAYGDVFWRVDDSELTLYANVSDVFAWGGSDAEPITPQTLDALERAYTDLKAVEAEEFTAELYAARQRGMRPQGAAYPSQTHESWRRVSALYDACGPERAVGFGNPKPAPDHAAAGPAPATDRAAGGTSGSLESSAANSTQPAFALNATDQADLRDRIAAALREHGMVHLGGQVPSDEYDCCAAAVLAVLPASTDRAAVLETENARMRHELEVMYGGAFDSLKSASSDQAAVLSEAERTMLTYALDQAQEKIWSQDGFTDDDQAAVTSLRRMADGATDAAASEASANETGASVAPTTDRAADLLRRTESYLSALHGSVARHDNLGANLGCAGCELRDQLAAALRRMADETPQPSVDLPTLAAALDGLHTLIATSSRDWQTYRVDAWLWAVLCGWDCEQAVHDETCTHGALEETAAMHGWDADAVAKARRYRSMVRATTEPAAVAQPDEEAKPRQSCACGQDGCEYCDADEEPTS